VRVVLAAIVVVALGSAVGAAAWFWFVCPCERTPGGPLSGEVVTSAVDDWSFANDVRLCQLEVDRVIPWSVNLNCMSTSGALYVSCSQCAGKAWSSAALEKPEGRIRIVERVYPVTLARLIDVSMLDVAWRARAQKLGRGLDTPRPDHWWSFQLTSR
jgi:hypothetical protein